MFLSQSNEKSFEERVKELEIQNEALNEETKALLEELEVTASQLSAYIANEEHFTESNWEELQRQKRILEEKLERDLCNIRNPKHTYQTYQNLDIGRHWLPMK